MIFGILACSLPVSTSEVVTIFEQVQQNPVQTMMRCQRLSKEPTHQECLSIGAHALTGNPTLKRSLCERLESTWQAECYFELAEEIGNIDDCLLAGRFKTDCQSHLLQQTCGQFQHLLQVYQYVTLHQIELTNGIEQLVYKCILDNKPYVPIHQCDSAHNPRNCEKVAVEIYNTNLQTRPFNCDRPQTHTKTSDHPTLTKLFESFQRQRCPVQD